MQITLKTMLFRHVNYIKHCKLSNNVYTTLIAHVYEDVRFFQLTQTTVPEITLHLFPVHVGCHKKTVITSDRIIYYIFSLNRPRTSKDPPKKSRYIQKWKQCRFFSTIKREIKKIIKTQGYWLFSKFLKKFNIQEN